MYGQLTVAVLYIGERGGVGEGINPALPGDWRRRHRRGIGFEEGSARTSTRPEAQGLGGFRSWHSGFLDSWKLLTLVLAAWALGSVIPYGVFRNMLLGILGSWTVEAHFDA